mmetsp:Transcript_122799/g.354974  ORF Transcript_122799/g.354974 Transcript_122799/m.354974 type:complete len:221 (-) Transcript_122799:841-1503(-)
MRPVMDCETADDSAAARRSNRGRSPFLDALISLRRHEGWKWMAWGNGSSRDSSALRKSNSKNRRPCLGCCCGDACCCCWRTQCAATSPGNTMKRTSFSTRASTRSVHGASDSWAPRFSLTAVKTRFKRMPKDRGVLQRNSSAADQTSLSCSKLFTPARPTAVQASSLPAAKIADFSPANIATARNGRKCSSPLVMYWSQSRSNTYSGVLAANNVMNQGVA